MNQRKDLKDESGLRGLRGLLNFPRTGAPLPGGAAAGGLLLLLLPCMLLGACTPPNDIDTEDEELIPLQVKADIEAQLTEPGTRAETPYEPEKSFSIFKDGDANTYTYSPPKNAGEAWTSSSPAYVGNREETFCMAGGELMARQGSLIMLSSTEGELIPDELSERYLRSKGLWYAFAPASKSEPAASFGTLGQFCTRLTLYINNRLTREAVLSCICLRNKDKYPITVTYAVDISDQRNKQTYQQDYRYTSRIDAANDALPHTLKLGEGGNVFNWILPWIQLGSNFNEEGQGELVLTVNGRELSVRLDPYHKYLNFYPGRRYILNLIIQEGELTLADPVQVENYGNRETLEEQTLTPWK